MTHRKDGSNQNLTERNLSGEYERVKEEESADTRDISNELEESDENLNDELDDDELTEDDFYVDEEDDEPVE